MNFRDFLTYLSKKRLINAVDSPTSPFLEISRHMRAQNTPFLFNNVKGSEYKVAGNIFASRDLFAMSLGARKEELLSKISAAIADPKKAKTVSKGPCQEVVEKKPDLNELPILTHYTRDDGPYITSGIVITRDPEYGQNVSFHRMKRLGSRRMSARICERHTAEYLRRAGGELEVAICIGNSAGCLLGGATSVAIGVNELDISNALESTKLVKCKTVDIEVPVESEIVLEGRIKRETAPEGRFVDITGTYDVIRQQPVIEIDCITHRKNPIYHAILPGANEHRLLMGMPREPTIFNEVNKVCNCTNVNLTTGGCSWLHGVVQIDKKNSDDGKKAIRAAFNGHGSMKQCVIVDKDIDPFNPEEVEWAIATRFQASKDLILMENQKGSSLDPSADEDTGSDRRITAKMGIDATIPSGKNKGEFTRVVE